MPFFLNRWSFKFKTPYLINFNSTALTILPACFSLVLNKTACAYGILVDYFLCIASRKGTTSLSPEKSPEGKLSQLCRLTSGAVNSHCKQVYVKNDLHIAFYNLIKSQIDNLAPYASCVATKFSDIGSPSNGQGAMPKVRCVHLLT